MATILTSEELNSASDLSTLDDPAHSSFVTARNKKKRPNEMNCAEFKDLTTELKNELKDYIKQLTDSQSTQINTVIATLKDIQQTNNMLQSTLLHLTEENIELKKKIEKLENKEKKNNEQIIILENKIEEIYILQRKTNIELKNVPLVGNEKKKDLLQIIFKLCETLQVSIDRTEVKDIIKTKKQNQERCTLIVELNNTFTKTDILKAAKNYNYKYKTCKLSAKHLGLKTYPDTPIFVSENLTPLSSRLYFLARDYKQVNNYKYCWTNYGKVYLRQDDTTPIINITRESQIQQLPKK